MGVEVLVYGLLIAYVLGALLLFGIHAHTPRCRGCRVAMLLLVHEIPETSPPVFELMYRCPQCAQVRRRYFVQALAD